MFSLVVRTGFSLLFSNMSWVITASLPTLYELVLSLYGVWAAVDESSMAYSVEDGCKKMGWGLSGYGLFSWESVQIWFWITTKLCFYFWLFLIWVSCLPVCVEIDQDRSRTKYSHKILDRVPVPSYFVTIRWIVLYLLTSVLQIHNIPDPRILTSD